MMKNKLSHSALNKYQDCAKAYEFRYVKRIVSKYKSGALYFGSAIDEALNDILNGKTREESKKSFDKWWSSQPDNENKWTQLKTNPDIVYSASDYDSDFMQKSDWAEAFGFLNDDSKTPWDEYNRIKKEKKEKGWPNVDIEDRKFYNLLNWLALRRKGHLMIDTYVENIMPNIKEVLAVQKYVRLDNEDGDYVRGYVDAVVRWKDDSVICLDNKTSSIEYEPDSVVKSPQLTLYKVILDNESEDKNSEWNHYIDKCGYAVLRKQPEKNITKTCQKCGHEADKGSRHKTCNNELDGKRCNGPWDRQVDIKINYQIIIDKIPDNVIDMVLDNVNVVNHSIKLEVFPRNFNACKKPWGLCEYYSKCWLNKEDDLIYKGTDNNVVK